MKDPRFEWAKDRRLILREVTPSDEGRYSIMLSSDFAYETVHLVVSGTAVSLLLACLPPLLCLFFNNFWTNDYHVYIHVCLHRICVHCQGDLSTGL